MWGEQMEKCKDGFVHQRENFDGRVRVSHSNRLMCPKLKLNIIVHEINFGREKRKKIINNGTNKLIFLFSKSKKKLQILCRIKFFHPT
jgi:hypothetical protein